MFLLVFFVSEGVVCWNSTGGYMSTDEGDLRSRQSRLFNFNTGDDEIVASTIHEISSELEIYILRRMR